MFHCNLCFVVVWAFSWTWRAKFRQNGTYHEILFKGEEIEVIQWYHENDKLVSRTAKNGMEKKLYEGFLELHKKGSSVRKLMFTLRGRQIRNDLYPEIAFKFSDHWFGWFPKRKEISLRNKTHRSQKDPAHLRL